jgi:hypothetical protein
MPGLVPGIDVLKRKLEDVDGRDALRAKRFAVDGNIPIPIIAGCTRSQNGVTSAHLCGGSTLRPKL